MPLLTVALTFKASTPAMGSGVARGYIEAVHTRFWATQHRVYIGDPAAGEGVQAGAVPTQLAGQPVLVLENSLIRQDTSEGNNSGVIIIGTAGGNQLLARFSGVVGPMGPGSTGPLRGRFMVVDGTGPDFTGTMGSGTYTGTADFANQRFTLTAAGTLFVP
ncbi:MAG: hypothetical protein IMW99_06105 [Firmicutes bacterium]|nr:hypothetical protein [Bacillota bacterium]